MPLTDETRFRRPGQSPQFKDRAAAQRSKQQCPKLHPYDDANTRIDKTGRRHCRACDRERAKRRRTEAKAEGVL